LNPHLHKKTLILIIT